MGLKGPLPSEKKNYKQRADREKIHKSGAEI